MTRGDITNEWARFWESYRDKLTPDEADTTLRAWRTAVIAHEGQERDGGTPYVLHPLRVAKIIVNELGEYDAQLVQAAILHDVIEENRTITPALIVEEFGDVVARIVGDLTKEPRGCLTREEAMKRYFERLSGACDASKVVKLADKLDNVRDSWNCPDRDKRKRAFDEARLLCRALSRTMKHRGIASGAVGGR